jgi:hypothetical protein
MPNLLLGNPESRVLREETTPDGSADFADYADYFEWFAS